jgi:hypothetical protein
MYSESKKVQESMENRELFDFEDSQLDGIFDKSFSLKPIINKKPSLFT